MKNNPFFWAVLLLAFNAYAYTKVTDAAVGLIFIIGMLTGISVLIYLFFNGFKRR